MSSSMALQGASSSLSSTSSSSWTHDVFLSFRGEDVRQKFISHLYYALHHRGINTCIDKNLERGEEISPELFKAIERSMISIIVLSKNYSESRWCLDELLKILECKEKVKQIVLPLFYDVAPSEVRHQTGSFGEAFAKLGCKIKDEVKVTEWKTALQKVANFFGFTLGDRNESEFIQDIIKWVDSIMVNRTFLNVAKYPVGLESRVQDIYEHLSMGMNDIICMVGIYGTGGIGKTTIAKEIYNRISYQFEGSCFLKNIRETSKAGGLIQLQKTLLSDLGISLDFHDIDRGISVIRHRLCSKKVLLILDDVDELVQLEALAGAPDWFGSGSRIIITTRDQHLLNISKVDSKYELKILANGEALKLFSLHAFEKDEPLDEYVELSKQVMEYAQGLPLALTVLGSTLKDQSIHQWKNVLNKYKQIPDINIQSVLRVSYDGLEDNEKDMFLDIAYFFKGEPLVDVIKIFDNCGFSPDYGIQRLIDKCLITVQEIVWMHDLLQYMGREIVRLQSPKEPGERSRLWFHEDVRHVLEESTGTNKIEGIIVEMPKGEETIILSPEAFVQMKRLRVFINRNARFSSGPNYLSNELRVLDWFEYPLQSLPSNFQGNKLIIFKMRDSFIKELSFIRFKNVTIMVFNDCNFLTKLPDLSSMLNLKELIVKKCTSLVEVHDSVGSLDNLIKLQFGECSNLRIFPRRLKLGSLRNFNLDCTNLREFPEIECEMKYLNLLRSPVEELPISIRNLTRLNVLIINGYDNIVLLPIFLPQNLRKLGIGGPTMEDEILLSGERYSVLCMQHPTNSSTALGVLNFLDCPQIESSFFPKSSFFIVFNSSATLKRLNISESHEMVSLPSKRICCTQ
ncbi:hypothetical protein I3842_15G103300 [Carya illinoinensis]|uniref:ADP-ribosyl cyclase/cyclic ADP-ribose hydrolase n=1 Tax=Carya illinoinensis TaxID=32201 RepID=A0A922D6V9_CARIL|nr:hypothetical protein I3842_15G103300 [Carya illinoinensis]